MIVGQCARDLKGPRSGGAGHDSIAPTGNSPPPMIMSESGEPRSCLLMRSVAGLVEVARFSVAASSDRQHARTSRFAILRSHRLEVDQLQHRTSSVFLTELCRIAVRVSLSCSRCLLAEGHLRKAGRHLKKVYRKSSERQPDL